MISEGISNIKQEPWSTRLLGLSGKLLPGIVSNRWDLWQAPHPTRTEVRLLLATNGLELGGLASLAWGVLTGQPSPAAGLTAYLLGRLGSAAVEERVLGRLYRSEQAFRPQTLNAAAVEDTFRQPIAVQLTGSIGKALLPTLLSSRRDLAREEMTPFEYRGQQAATVLEGVGMAAFLAGETEVGAGIYLFGRLASLMAEAMASQRVIDRERPPAKIRLRLPTLPKFSLRR